MAERASGDKGSASTRPARPRVVRLDVQEVLRSPRRGRPKKQQPPPPSPPRAPSPPPTPPPARQEEEEKKEEGEESKEEERACYNCAFQDESRDFAPPDLVWGKVRSHPWWPGQVFDPADASEVALQHRRSGAPLVAYFWDRTFAWNDSSALLPFRANFARLSAQSTMFGFVSAVDAALQEVGRRVEAGLSCGCFGSTATTKQEVHNSGVRQGAYGAVVDTAYVRDALSGKAFLDYISALGQRPLAGADLLDLATAKAQLRAFNRSRGPMGLPEFVLFEGIEDAADDDILHTKRKRMHKSNGNDVLSKEKKLRRAASSSKNEDVTDEEVMDAPSKDEAKPNKGNNSKGRKSSTNKNANMSKHSDGFETAAAAAGDRSRTSAKNAVDDVLRKNKSVRTLRSMSKKEDALEGLEKLGKGGGGGGETLTTNSKDTPLLKENKPKHIASAARKKDIITEDGDIPGDGSSKGSTSSGKRRLGTENSGSKRVLISEHGRKKKKLSELMSETVKPNSTSYRKRKTRGTPSLHVSDVKAEDPNRDSKDTTTTRKRKKLNTLGDLSSHSQSISRKKSTKVGACMSKASGHTSRTPPPVKANGTAPQKKLHRTKHNHTRAVDKSPHSAKVNRSKKDVITEESLSCGEMLWQLALAACDLKHRERIAPTSVNFFTGFRKNSTVSSCDVDKESPEKAAGTESTLSEQPIADHMQDDYWADILINVEEPLSSLKKKDESKKRTSKKAHQVKKLLNDSSVNVESAGNSRSENNTENGGQPKDGSKAFIMNKSELNAGTKSAEEIENSLLAGLVLHFSRPSAVPSRSDLIKIFSQYGPVKEAKAEIANSSNSAQVIFKRRMDAEAAFAGAGKISALGPALDSFRLTDFPAAAASGDEPSHGAAKSGE